MSYYQVLWGFHQLLIKKYNQASRHKGMSRGKGNSIKNHGANLEILMDSISRNTRPASLVGGRYTFTGNQTTFRTQSQNVPSAQPYMMPQISLPGVLSQQQNMAFPQANLTMQSMMGQQMPQFNRQGAVLEANLTIVGTKTRQANSCCFTMTILTGSLCFIPVCFMCCMWWKKIVYPTYQLGIGAYRDIANFISRYPYLKHLSITVADNAFNAEKARILYDALSRIRIGGFEFINSALNCNGQFNEADTFIQNMTPIKGLNMATNMFWGDMIV